VPQGSFVTSLTVIRLGLCGCLTSFAGWNQTMVQLFAAGAWQLPMIGYLGGLLGSLSAVYVGQRVALRVARSSTEQDRERNAKRARALSDFFRQQRTALKATSALLIALIGALMGTVSVLHVQGALGSADSVAYSIGEMLPLRLSLGLLWAPFGVLLRWRLLILNSFYTPVPLGTLLSNLLGVGIVGLMYGFDDDATPYSPFWHEFTHSVALGFCGCLTTVSTFAFEVISRLRPEPLSSSSSNAPKNLCGSRSCWCAGPIYALVTLFLGCLVGIAAYSPHACNEANGFCHTHLETGALEVFSKMQLEPSV